MTEPTEINIDETDSAEAGACASCPGDASAPCTDAPSLSSVAAQALACRVVDLMQEAAEKGRSRIVLLIQHGFTQPTSAECAALQQALERRFPRDTILVRLFEDEADRRACQLAAAEPIGMAVAMIEWTAK